jgi:hypothetical protein
MKTMKSFLVNATAAALGLGLLSALLPAETLTYREVDGDRRTTHTITIVPAGTGYGVELTSRRDGGDAVRQTFRVAAGLSTQGWSFSDPGRRMELAAAVRGGEIVLSGSFQGKKVDERFDADGAPWNQLFQMGLGPFVLSGRKSMSFRSIGTQGPGELKIGKMTVTRQGEEAIELNGRTVAAVRVRISLSGLLSVFWHGDYWYRKSDGRFLRYRGKNRSGGPVAVSELIEEKADAS